MLWRDRAIGWANISAANGDMAADIGYITGRPPRDRKFKSALETELERFRAFLNRGQMGVR